MQQLRTKTGVKKSTIWIKLGAILIPVMLLIAVLEGGTRLLVWAFYGAGNFGMHWLFEYEPYLLTKTAPIPQYVSPKGERYRVVLVGGSTAAQMPVNVLEDALKTITHRNVQVINLGQGGYIINQERIILLLYGIRLDPDLIISLDGMNDIVTASKVRKTGITYSNNFIEFAVNHPLLNGFVSVFRQSQFVNSINKVRERNLEKSVQKDTKLKNEIIRHTEEGLRSIAIIANGMDIPYVIVIQPYLHLRRNIPEVEKNLASNYTYRKDFMSEMIENLNGHLEKSAFPGKTYYIDATKAFDGSTSQCFVDEVHLTNNGNEILANYLVNAAQKKGFAIQ